jgi:hypothetical protein
MSVLPADLLSRAWSALARSGLLRATGLVRRDGGRRFALGEVTLRPLSASEVARLEARGCSADDWSTVLVTEGFDADRVRDAHFHGDVVLGRFTGRVCVGEGLELPAGVYGSTVANCVIGPDALVRDVRLLANCTVGAGAVLFDCGRITCDTGTTFGNGAILPIGIETGGRPLRVYAEMDIEQALAVARPRGAAELREGLDALAAEYAGGAVAGRGIIDRGAHVLGTSRVRNAFIGAGARVDGATLVEESTLLSSAEEQTCVASGACVSGSLLQWGSQVSTLALVERSLLAEHVHVERHAKVTDSILGPNTVVGGGEVTSSLLGPFVAAHHQSLLIATLWPAGRGNIGYGANIGSNHTSRAPDQELFAGEGMFFGLGVNVKFPADFSRAPYTVVACGASVQPQRMTFPFSLIAPPSFQPAGISPACMELAPAWMLSENLFALRRNEAKYRARNKARRTQFDFAVIRPDTVDLMREACRRLEGARGQEVYTEADIEGLGKNFLLERNRLRAIEAYRFFIRSYALQGLKERVASILAAGGVPEKLLTIPSSDPRWEHQRQLLVELGIRDVCEGLRELPAILETIARKVERSRARDDRRGAQILDDYADTHVPAERDACVRQARDEARGGADEVARLLRLLPQGASGVCETPSSPRTGGVTFATGLPAEAPPVISGR